MNRDQALAASGAGSVLVTLSAILLATLVSPSFTWPANALSDLGVARTPAGTGLTVLLFNGGLVVGALLGLGFAALRWRRAASTLQRLVAVLFVATLLAMAGVGLFPAGSALHVPAAVAFYVLVTVTLWVDAWDAGGGPGGRRGAVQTWLGAANVATWAVWALTGPVRRPGLAIPEIIGALVLSAWVLSESMRFTGAADFLDGEPTSDLSR
jgi:hypothetical membrane protein